MQPNNLTALDFEDIKASIKSYLRTRSEFTDYDFDDSALSYMIDMLPTILIILRSMPICH